MPKVTLPSDYALVAASRRLVSTCLSMVSGDRLLIITDRSRTEIAAAIDEAARSAGVEPVMLVLEELGSRPHVRMRDAIREAMKDAQASVMPITFEEGEFEMRAEVIAEASRRGLRHAHMVGVTRDSIVTGLSVARRRIARIAGALLVRLRPISTLHVRSASGTDLIVRCDPNARWGECSGVIGKGRRDNVPSGEMMTCPLGADGIYVADASIGDAGGRLRGKITQPIRLRIANGRVVSVDSVDGSLSARVTERMRRGTNLDRVGIVSFGTNVGINVPQDDIFTDQKRPGFHLSLGFTSPENTGATWNASSWIAFTALGSDVDIDGTPVMRSGRYLIA